MKNLILRPGQVSKLLGISKPTIWRLEKDGQFPSKIKLGPNMTGYLAADIEDWLVSRVVDGEQDRIRASVARAMEQNEQEQDNLGA